MDIKIIVGLGNPGKEYERTRHNAGFMVVDTLAKQIGATWKHEPKLRSMMAEGIIEGEKMVFVKPTTYMNASGEAVRLVMDYLKVLPASILVVSDDIDLPLGQLRFRTEGGAGGHNGLKSMIQCLGTQQFLRLKVGVDAPPEKVPLEAYVLQKFAGHEHDVIDRSVKKAVEIVLAPSILQETTWTV
jgi:PTH1 family peptidyl-tRNA hydrolase